MQDATARFGSVDWAARNHAACIVDAAGRILDQFTVDHTALGLATLTCAWIGVIWRCWQDHQPYDPARHRALQHVIAPGA